MSQRVNAGTELRKYLRKYNQMDKLGSIIDLLGSEAQEIIDWAYKEAEARMSEEPSLKKGGLGKLVFELVSNEAAVRLVQRNQARGRLTTKSEVKAKTGQRVEMPVLYRQAGLRHPQEARNLRHNMFHEAFHSLILHLFPEVSTSVPSTGEGLTPDLMVTHEKPDWTISVEYKGYRSLTLLSESELLKAMRYQDAYGTAWLVTTTMKSIAGSYEGTITSKEIVKRGLERLRAVYKRKAYTTEQRENRGIARKGIAHLQKHEDMNLRCQMHTAKSLIDSMKSGKPLKGVIITTGFEFIDMLKDAGLVEHAENVLRVMKSPANLLHSDTVTSMRLIE